MDNLDVPSDVDTTLTPWNKSNVSSFPIVSILSTIASAVVLSKYLETYKVIVAPDESLTVALASVDFDAHVVSHVIFVPVSFLKRPLKVTLVLCG